MKTTIEIKIRPFAVPNYVLADGGVIEGRKYALNELDAETLEALCWKFKQEVFAKAGKKTPPTAV